MTHMNRFTVDMYTSLFHFILNQFSVKKKKNELKFLNYYRCDWNVQRTVKSVV